MVKSIKIPFSEGDLNDLLNGEEFNWTFDGVMCHIFQGCEECEKPINDCVCGVDE